MKAATAQQIKQELKGRDAAQLTEMCLRLARFKKENKELLTFLLFEENDLPAYIQGVKEEMDEQFRAVNTSNLYFVKKTLRKILRAANKYIRYTGDKTAETEILLHYLAGFRALNLSMGRSTAIKNIYLGQLKKSRTAIEGLHEDLQFEYLRVWEQLNGYL